MFIWASYNAEANDGHFLKRSCFIIIHYAFVHRLTISAKRASRFSAFISWYVIPKWARTTLNDIWSFHSSLLLLIMRTRSFGHAPHDMKGGKKTTRLLSWFCSLTTRSLTARLWQRLSNCQKSRMSWDWPLGLLIIEIKWTSLGRSSSSDRHNSTAPQVAHTLKRTSRTSPASPWLHSDTQGSALF